MQENTQAKEASAPLLVNERRAAAMLGISSRTIFSMAARGDLATVRIGKRKLITVASVQDFIQRTATRTEGGAAHA